MAKENIAVVLHGKGNMCMEEWPRRKPGYGEVEIKMRAVGICGSDVHYYLHGGIGSFTVERPMVIGHEGSGDVVAVGEGVTSLKVGDRVAIEPGIACHTCQHCTTGQYNLCEAMAFCATPPNHGLLQHYFTHPAGLCFRINDEVTYEEAAMAEPLSVCIHAMRLAGAVCGNKILITGAGTIGLLMTMLCKSLAIYDICVVDISSSRLEVATKIGASSVVLLSDEVTSSSAEERANQIVDKAGHSFDVVFECTGVEACIQASILSIQPGGKHVQVGISQSDVAIPLAKILMKEIQIITSMRYRHTWPLAVDLLSKKLVDVSPLITHHYALGEYSAAFTTAQLQRDGAIKVMFNLD